MPTVPRSEARPARLFHALADPTRLRILERLADGEQCVCELTDALESGQSRLSFHLKTLKDAGLVGDRRQGRWVYYAVKTDTLAELRAVVEAIGGGASPPAPARELARRVNPVAQPDPSTRLDRRRERPDE